MVMFLLSFVKGSKSAEGGPNPLADTDPGGPNPLADMDRGGGGWGSKSASGFGPGGPILGGSKSARTPEPSLLIICPTIKLKAINTTGYK